MFQRDCGISMELLRIASHHTFPLFIVSMVGARVKWVASTMSCDPMTVFRDSLSWLVEFIAKILQFQPEVQQKIF